MTKPRCRPSIVSLIDPGSPSRTAASWKQNCRLGYRIVFIMSSSSNDSSPIRMTFLSIPQVSNPIDVYNV
jgi:hypothetical protein